LIEHFAGVAARQSMTKFDSGQPRSRSGYYPDGISLASVPLNSPNQKEHRIMIDFVYFVSLARRGLLVASILVASCCVFCAQADGQARAGMRQHGGVERELVELTQALGLSGDQQAQVKAVLEERRSKMEALRASGAPPSREQIELIHKEANQKIAALLSDDQKGKFAAWQQQNRERRRGQGSGEATPPQPPNI
jgi:septal ring factor EnvC (AmiA/AmiB activator)